MLTAVVGRGLGPQGTHDVDVLVGPSAAPGDASQLTDQDFSPAELTKQFDNMPQRLGALGQRAHDDIQSYVDGINARIDEVNSNPSLMPAEYPALGTRPAPWTVADSGLSFHLCRALVEPAASSGKRDRLVAALGKQRLAPLEPHLKGVRRLLVVPTEWMALVPVEVEPDAEVWVDIRGRAAPFRVTRPPFVPSHVR